VPCRVGRVTSGTGRVACSPRSQAGYDSSTNPAPGASGDTAQGGELGHANEPVGIRRRLPATRGRPCWQPVLSARTSRARPAPEPGYRPLRRRGVAADGLLGKAEVLGGAGEVRAPPSVHDLLAHRPSRLVAQAADTAATRTWHPRQCRQGPGRQPETARPERLGVSDDTARHIRSSVPRAVMGSPCRPGASVRAAVRSATPATAASLPAGSANSRRRPSRVRSSFGAAPDAIGPARRFRGLSGP
jgi:hypothetical protein